MMLTIIFMTLTFQCFNSSGLRQQVLVVPYHLGVELLVQQRNAIGQFAQGLSNHLGLDGGTGEGLGVKILLK